MSMLPLMSPRVISLDQDSSHLVSSSTSETGGLKNNIVSIKSNMAKPRSRQGVTPSKTWSKLHPGAKNQLDSIIMDQGCKKNVSLTAEVWDKNNKFFDSLGITLPAICYRTGLNYKVLWQAVDNIRMKRVMQNTPLTDRQKTVLEQILPCNGEHLGPADAAELWQRNSVQLLLAGISRTMFAFHCSLNTNALKSAIWRHEKNSHTPQLVSDTERVLEKLILLNGGKNISDSKACSALTTAVQEEKLICYTDIVTHRKEQAAIKEVQQKELLTRLVDVNAYPDKKIAATSSWITNKALFKETGISRNMLASHCKLSRSHIDKLIRTENRANSDIPLDQQEIIRLVMSKTRCYGVTSKAVAAFMNNEALMTKHKIRTFAFARIANVNINAFDYVYYEKLRAEEQPTSKQQGVLERIMGEHKGSSDVRYLSYVFLKHREELLAEKITQALFAKFNQLALAKFKSALFDLRNNSKKPLTQVVTPELTVSQKLYPNSRRNNWEKLSPASKKMLEEFISTEGCVGNTRKSAMLWHQKKDVLHAEGIDYLAFSYRCQLQHRTFIKTVNRPFFQLVTS